MGDFVTTALKGNKSCLHSLLLASEALENTWGLLWVNIIWETNSVAMTFTSHAENSIMDGSRSFCLKENYVVHAGYCEFD